MTAIWTLKLKFYRGKSSDWAMALKTTTTNATAANTPRRGEHDGPASDSSVVVEEFKLVVLSMACAKPRL